VTPHQGQPPRNRRLVTTNAAALERPLAPAENLRGPGDSRRVLLLPRRMHGCLPHAPGLDLRAPTHHIDGPPRKMARSQYPSAPPSAPPHHTALDYQPGRDSQHSPAFARRNCAKAAYIGSSARPKFGPPPPPLGPHTNAYRELAGRGFGHCLSVVPKRCPCPLSERVDGKRTSGLCERWPRQPGLTPHRYPDARWIRVDVGG
jgi:hypothetical protein